MGEQRNVTIELYFERCYTCGRWYALEQRGPGERGCAYCMAGYWRAAQKGNEQRDKTISALRGALTKARKRGRHG